MAKPKKNTTLFNYKKFKQLAYLHSELSALTSDSPKAEDNKFLAKIIKENKLSEDIQTELKGYQKRIASIDKQIEESYKKYSNIKNKKANNLKRVVRGLAKNIGTLGFINLANKQKMNKGLSKHNDDFLSSGEALITRKNRLIKLREENLAKFSQLSALAEKKLGKGNEVSETLTSIMRSERVDIAHDKQQSANFSKKTSIEVNKKGKKVTKSTAKPREWNKGEAGYVLDHIEPHNAANTTGTLRYKKVMMTDDPLTKFEKETEAKLKTSGKKSFVKQLEKASKKNEAKLNEIKAEHPTYKGKGKKGGISMGWFGGR